MPNTRQKANQAQLKRNSGKEEAFKKRYNRKVEVYDAITLSETGLLDSVAVHIIDETGKKYILNEKFTEEQLTDYVDIESNGKTHRTKSFLEAEVIVADKIGEKKIKE